MRNLLHADVLKLKRTPFFVAHLAVPVFGVLIFTIYMGITGYAAESLTIIYLTILSMIFPILTAWICSIVADQELDAGGGFFMLSAVSRHKVLFSKMVFLLGIGLVACLLVVLGYGMLAPTVRVDYLPDFRLLFASALILWGCSIFLYPFHLWLNLKFGRSVSFAVAAIEMLLAALMRTGLGEVIWCFVPSAWGIRLIKLTDLFLRGEEVSTFLPGTLILPVILFMTVGMCVILFVWICRWEGRKNEE